MGHKINKIYDFETLPEEEKSLLIQCVCGSLPVFCYDPRKKIYRVECSKENCPGKATHSERRRAVSLWFAAVSPAKKSV